MSTIGFREFLENVVTESLHPELHDIVTSPSRPGKAKQVTITKKIQELHSRGEETGLAGNMPKGSSRMYMPHQDPHPVTLDGKDSYLDTGTKVAIRTSVEQYHNKSKFGGLSLGGMQNHAENDDHFVNQQYRILHKSDHDTFHTNTEKGIFPPLIDHDEKNHEWAHVGHASDVS